MTQPTVDFKTAFEALPGSFLILQPNPPYYTILAVSDELLHITNQEREKVIGKSLFEVYPESPEAIAASGPSNLRDSLQSTILNQRSDQMTLVRYDVPNAAGIFEERYWSATNKPVMDSEGKVLYIIQSTHDVTQQTKAENKLQNLRKIENTYNLLLQSSVAACVVTGAENIIEMVSEEMLAFWGLGLEIVGKPLLECLPEAREQGFPEVLDQVRKTGEPFYATAYPTTLMVEGKKEKRYYNFVLKPYYEYPEDQTPAGVFSIAIDVTEQVIARKQVEETAEELNRLANAMPQVVWIAEANGEVTFYNDRISAFEGAKQLPDGTWYWKGLLVPEDVLPTVEAWNKAVAEGISYEKEHRVQMKDGSHRWHLSRAYPQKDEKGTVVKWYGTATDVHAQKESEEQLRIALEGAELGTFSFYTQTGKILWSSKTKELYGLPPEAELTPDIILNAMHLEDRERSHAAIQGAMLPENGGFYENEYRVIGITDGKLRWLRSKGKVSFDAEGKPLRFTGVTQEITMRKQAEEALEVKNAQLVRINNDLDNFIYTASHDLKAPISNIEGLLHALFRTLPPESLASEQTQRITSLMQESVERFKKTIANLTEVVKLQKENSGEEVSVNISEVVEEVLLDLEQHILSSGAQIDIDVAGCPPIYFSEKNLRSVVYNLLSNGIKYRSPERVPRVSIRCQSTPEHLLLSVQDNGLGIEKRRIGQLFTMFKRFHTHVEGSGIGLYMIKKMVENAGGRIEVESQEGEGTTFKVYFKR